MTVVTDKNALVENPVAPEKPIMTEKPKSRKRPETVVEMMKRVKERGYW